MKGALQKNSRHFHKAPGRRRIPVRWAGRGQAREDHLLCAAYVVNTNDAQHVSLTKGVSSSRAWNCTSSPCESSSSCSEARAAAGSASPPRPCEERVLETAELLHPFGPADHVHHHARADFVGLRGLDPGVAFPSARAPDEHHEANPGLCESHFANEADPRRHPSAWIARNSLKR
jgi:hypothetical protein